MAWRIAVVTEDGTEKLEMAPDVLLEFFIACSKSQANGDEELNQRVQNAIKAGFEKAVAYLKAETVRLQ